MANSRRWALMLVFAGLFAAPLFSDSIEEADAKRRGVSVEKVQLENAQAKIQALETQIVDLQKQLAETKAGATAKTPAATTPSSPTTAKRPFVPTDTFTSRAKAQAPHLMYAEDGPKSIKEAQKLDQKIALYLTTHPDTSDELAAAMYTGTPKPGMTEEQVMVFCFLVEIKTETLASKTIWVQPLDGTYEGSPHRGYELVVPKNRPVEKVKRQ